MKQNNAPAGGRPVGDTFTYRGRTYVVVWGEGCELCDLVRYCGPSARVSGNCSSRSDGRRVIFVKVDDKRKEENDEKRRI